MNEKLAEKIRDIGLDEIGNGTDAAEVVEAMMAASLAVGRIWMTPAEVALVLRHWADHIEPGAEAARKKDH